MTYSLFFDSIQMVTGPSFVSSIFISAPKLPVATLRPSAASTFATNSSYRGIDMASGAALIHEGRLPFLVMAWSVNWLTIITSPSTSCTEQFIMPSASSKMRNCTSFYVSHSKSSAVSSWPTPPRTTKPLPISLNTAPSIWQRASVTRCKSSLIG